MYRYLLVYSTLAPVTVGLNLVIERLTLNPHAQTVKIGGFLFQEWVDSRLDLSKQEVTNSKVTQLVQLSDMYKQDKVEDELLIPIKRLFQYYH